MEALRRSYVEDQQRGVTANMREVMEVLVPRKDDIQHGPVYAVETAQGMPLRVNLLFLDNADDAARTYFLLAHTMDGRLAGYRGSDLKKGETNYTVRGGVETVLRNAGVTTPIELVHADVLQREADALGLPVVEESIDANGSKWQNLLFAYEGYKHIFPEEPEIVREKRLEHERWELMWGKDGQMGYSEVDGFSTPVKIYTPQTPALPHFSHFNAITLQRVTYSHNGRFLVRGDVVTAEQFTEDGSLERKKHFESAIIPQIKALAEQFTKTPGLAIPKPVI